MSKPELRDAYDADNLGDHKNMSHEEALYLFQEEFQDNAWDSDSDSDSDSESGLDEGDDFEGISDKEPLHPFHHQIYQRATPIILKYLSTLERPASDATTIKDLNKEIKQYNNENGVRVEYWGYIIPTPYEAQGTLAHKWLEILKKDPSHSQAREWVDFINHNLRELNKKTQTPKNWVLTIPGEPPKSRKPAASRTVVKSMITRGPMVLTEGIDPWDAWSPQIELRDAGDGAQRIGYYQRHGYGEFVIVESGPPDASRWRLQKASEAGIARPANAVNIMDQRLPDARTCQKAGLCKPLMLAIIFVAWRPVPEMGFKIPTDILRYRPLDEKPLKTPQGRKLVVHVQVMVKSIQNGKLRAT